MKLRLKGDSIRVPLDRRDILRLMESGRVDDAVHFGPGLASWYAVEAAPAPRDRPQATYAGGRITIRINSEEAAEWREGDRVGFDHHQSVHGGSVRVLLEKDFALPRPTSGRGGGRHPRLPQPGTELLKRLQTIPEDRR